MEPIILTKKELRKILKTALKQKTIDESINVGDKLADQIAQIIPKNANIACFISKFPEVSTNRIIQKLYDELTCTVYFPTWKEQSMWMVPLSQESYQKIINKDANYYHKKYGHHIPMPENNHYSLDEIDYCITPGCLIL